MTGLVRPGEHPADAIRRMGCVADYLSESIPAWSLETEPSREAVEGLAVLLQLLAGAAHELAREMTGLTPPPGS